MKNLIWEKTAGMNHWATDDHTWRIIQTMGPELDVSGDKNRIVWFYSLFFTNHQTSSTHWIATLDTLEEAQNVAATTDVEL